MEKIGPLLPVWIIGAPLVLAIVDRMRTPKPTRRDEQYANPGLRV